MEDFNTHTVNMREKWQMSPKTAFIAFGGSYGGNLALWLRLKVSMLNSSISCYLHALPRHLHPAYI